MQVHRSAYSKLLSWRTSQEKPPSMWLYHRSTYRLTLLLICNLSAKSRNLVLCPVRWQREMY